MYFTVKSWHAHGRSQGIKEQFFSPFDVALWIVGTVSLCVLLISSLHYRFSGTVANPVAAPAALAPASPTAPSTPSDIPNTKSQLPPIRTHPHSNRLTPAWTLRIRQAIETLAAKPSDKITDSWQLWLTGIVMTPGTSVAIFSANDGKTIEANVGTNLLGMRVSSIAEGVVTLDNNGTQAALQVGYPIRKVLRFQGTASKSSAGTQPAPRRQSPSHKDATRYRKSSNEGEANEHLR